ncbi:MAG: alpha/beta hydrolase fold domain-containing protein [Acidimicrobiia bacterium]|nr:alpha/beta hydrolase fold domain-containing protein [Acidimicrobiia bacterium]
MLGATRAIIRRLRHGPTLPSWPWSLELLVGAFRAASFTGVDHLELLAPGPRGLPRRRARTRGPLREEQVDLDGVPATRFTPRDRDPDGPTRTLLYLHGGGFVSGSVQFERRPARDHARTTGCDTYSIEYRLAPRHPYPAALDDAVRAYRALLDRGADPARTLLFGGSAGAGLALSLLLRARDEGLPMPAGAAVVWPYADFTFSGPSIETNADIDLLPLRDLAPKWRAAYLGDHDPTDPLVSPALAELHGLPPLLIVAGGVRKPCCPARNSWPSTHGRPASRRG